MKRCGDLSNQNALVALLTITPFNIMWPYLQICIPYLDPAMLQSRQQIFELTYGFKCTCPSCTYLSTCISHISDFPNHPNKAAELERQLRRKIFSSEDWLTDVTWRQPSWISGNTLSEELLPVLQESYLASLADRFSRCSHEGPYDKALEDGYTLLALYVLIYPPNYPQIGACRIML